MSIPSVSGPASVLGGPNAGLTSVPANSSSAADENPETRFETEVGDQFPIEHSSQAMPLDDNAEDAADGDLRAADPDLDGIGHEQPDAVEEGDGLTSSSLQSAGPGVDDTSEVHRSITIDAPPLQTVESFAGGAPGSGNHQTETSYSSGNVSLQTLADQLSDDYWTIPFKWNLSDSGYQAKDGVLTFNITGNEEDGDGLTSPRQELVREAFKVYEEVLGIDFQETNSTGADIRFSDNKGGAFASSSFGIIGDQGYTVQSVVNIQKSWYGSSSDYDGYTYQTILHEIGHVLGLGHTGDYNGSGSYANDAKFANDSWQGSIMSYFSQHENTAVDASFAFLLSPMAADWLALDDLYSEYGYGTVNAFAGDTVWGFNTTITEDVSKAWANLSTYADNMAFTIIDGGGTDTVDFSGYAHDQRIDLSVTEGSFTQATTSDIGNEIGNMTLAVGTVIENAVGGTGNDLLIGNDVDNTLQGGGGDDTLTGGDGNDDLHGGSGTDIAVFLGNFDDYVFTSFADHWLVTGEGADRVFDTIESLAFQDQTVAYGDLGGSPTIGGGAGPASVSDARDDALSVGEDGVLSANLFADNGTGADSHSLGLGFAVTNVGGAAPGTVILSNGASYTVESTGAISFSTNGAYNTLADGQIATVSFDYTITSTDGETDTATATITITGSNDGPTAAADAFTAEEGSSLIGNVLGDNGAGADSDVDQGDVLVVSGVQGGGLGTVTLASGARVTMSANGQFSYDQAGAFDALNTGQTATDSFTYAISDGNDGVATATATITVNGVDASAAVTGTAIADQMTGSTSGDVMDGLAGDDRMWGGEGHDNLLGGQGRDRLFGEVGDDTLTGGADRDTLDGGSGSDTLSGGADNDRLDGGADSDVLYGGEGNDRMDGGDGADSIYGDTGNDRINGEAGQDHIYGGEGNDSLKGGHDEDNLFGGIGNDRLSGDQGNDTLNGGDGDDALSGNDGNDMLFGGDGADRLSGSNGNDSLFGGDGADRLSGGNGDDWFVGGEGADLLNGQRGFDTVSYADATSAVTVSFDRRADNGGAAEGDELRQIEAVIATGFDDTLTGDKANNQFTGGAGSDRFVFTSTKIGADTITDFEDGSDLLDFTQAGLSFSDFSISQVGADAVLTLTSLNTNSVTLLNTQASNIDQNDFV
ncbi:MAG: M10 family metallopeptidase [Pseudomonadota bacterium]